jgi:hypothetical protein
MVPAGAQGHMSFVTAKRRPLAAPADCRTPGRSSAIWRSIMKKLFAVLALVAMIVVPTLAQTANAAPVSPASSSFGDNGY